MSDCAPDETTECTNLENSCLSKTSTDSSRCAGGMGHDGIRFGFALPDPPVAENC